MGFGGITKILKGLTFQIWIYCSTRNTKAIKVYIEINTIEMNGMPTFMKVLNICYAMPNNVHQELLHSSYDVGEKFTENIMKNQSTQNTQKSKNDINDTFLCGWLMTEKLQILPSRVLK